MTQFGLGLNRIIIFFARPSFCTYNTSIVLYRTSTRTAQLLYCTIPLVSDTVTIQCTCTYYIITLLKVAILTLTIAAKKDYAITVQKVAILTLTIATKKILCNYGTKRGNPNPNDCRKKKAMQLRYL
jgi:hypothetical protein